MSDHHDAPSPADLRLRAAAAEGCDESRLLLSRRSMLGVTAGLFSWAFMPRDAEASVADPRLLVVVLRGGMDGLSAVVPYGDLDYVSSRGELAIPSASLNRIDGFFGLHPALRTFAGLYGAGDASIVHAACVPLRTRSHFDCQDNLESGLPGAGLATTGWLNRLLEVLPAGAPLKTRGAIEISDAPLLLRGAAPVLGWTSTQIAPVKDPTLYLIRSLYRAIDKPLSGKLELGLQAERMADGLGSDPPTMSDLTRSFRGAGRLLAAPVGPRIAVLSVQGWDTHTSQGGASGILHDRLKELDDGLAAFKTTVGSAWGSTVVLMVTEFGRTVANNGNHGTDHGVGTVALLAGGAVAGGKVIADWPGLKAAKLYDGRDLMPTTDLRSVFKGVLREHLAVPDSIITGTLFPDSLDAPPLAGLIKGA